MVRLAVGLLLVLLLLSAWWLWTAGAPAPPPPTAATPTESPGETPTPTPLAAPPGFRLAGVALREPDSFVVVEAPDGSNVLYRLNAEIPGLGRLVRIEAERIVLRGASGEFELWLAPAATPTPTRTPRLRTPTPTPGLPPSARTAPGSKTLSAPGRPAS